MLDQPVDKARYEESMKRLYEIFSGISEATDQLSKWRCPYKNASSRCTAKFDCRNQYITPIPNDLPVCSGNDKIDYRSAWQV